jgi:transposase-like protein
MADQELTDLRRWLSGQERIAGRRLSAELRARAAAWAHRQIDAGSTIAAVAVALGVAPVTVRRWLSTVEPATGESHELVRVEVIAEEARAPAAARMLSVVGPDGYRVEGLSVAEAAMLLRALR